MRAAVLLTLLLVTLAPAGEPELSAELYSEFGSDFTRGELDYAPGAGDGDGLYYGGFDLRPTLYWREVGDLEITLTAGFDELEDPSLHLDVYRATAGVDLPFVGELRGGVHNLRWGCAGLYNRELGGISPRPCVYDAEPLGLSLGNDYGGVNYAFVCGLGRMDEPSDDSLLALSVGYADGTVDLALYAVADSKPYDVRNLFFEQYVSRAPGVRNNIKPGTWTYREAQLNDVPETRHDLLQTLALGLTLEGGFEEPLGYYLALAYTSYADEDPGVSSGNLTGGVHLFLYPELVFRAGSFEAYVAGHVDYWKSNDTDGLDIVSAYEAGELISSTLAYEVYAEGSLRVADDLKVALGGGYTEPSTSGEDISDTVGDDAFDASLFVTPRVIWEAESDLAGLRFTLGGLYRQWAVALYDVTGGDADESREITGWFRVEAEL
jgi:hypothetical protein